MKRCPDCGFRVKDPEFRICPLCGVRMLHDPDGQTVQYKLHVHEQKGEACLLSNQSEKVAERERYRRIMEQPHRTASQARHEARTLRNSVKLPKQEKTPASGKTILGIVLAVLWILFQACTG